MRCCLNSDLQGIDSTVWAINSQVTPDTISITTFPGALTFTDGSGTHPQFQVGSDNDFVFYGTNATGVLQPIWHSPMRTSGSFSVDNARRAGARSLFLGFFPSFELN